MGGCFHCDLSFFCSACQCNEHGTVNGSLNCQNVTGECSCKPNIDQRTCSQCKLDFYGFPNTTHGDCLQCNCDYGGSTADICEKDEGEWNYHDDSFVKRKVLPRNFRVAESCCCVFLVRYRQMFVQTRHTERKMFQRHTGSILSEI